MQSSENVNAQRPGEDAAMSVPLPPAMNTNGAQRCLGGPFLSLSAGMMFLKLRYCGLQKQFQVIVRITLMKISKIFCVMFPDSQIAAKFTCGSRKTSYICVFV